MLFKRFGLDLDRWGWPTVALFLSGLDVALFAVGRLADLLWFGATSYGFFAGTLIFLALVWLDARGAGMARGWWWALVATFLPLVGTIPYAQRRCATVGAPGHPARPAQAQGGDHGTQPLNSTGR